MFASEEAVQICVKCWDTQHNAHKRRESLPRQLDYWLVTGLNIALHDKQLLIIKPRLGFYWTHLYVRDCRVKEKRAADWHILPPMSFRTSTIPNLYTTTPYITTVNCTVDLVVVYRTVYRVTPAVYRATPTVYTITPTTQSNSVEGLEYNTTGVETVFCPCNSDKG